jgi:hypothetical protein
VSQLIRPIRGVGRLAVAGRRGPLDAVVEAQLYRRFRASCHDDANMAIIDR